MKLQFIIYVFAFGCANINPHRAWSQKSMDLVQLNTTRSIAAPVTGEAATRINTDEAYKNAVNLRAVRHFMKEFKHAGNVSWLRAKDRGYLAQFEMDSIQTSVAYNHTGSWTYTLEKYAENRMAADLRTVVKRAFIDHVITEVTKITLSGKEQIIYSVLIKNRRNFKVLQIINHEIEIIRDQLISECNEFELAAKAK